MALCPLLLSSQPPDPTSLAAPGRWKKPIPWSGPGAILMERGTCSPHSQAQGDALRKSGLGAGTRTPISLYTGFVNDESPLCF